MDSDGPTREQLQREADDLRGQLADLRASRDRFRDLVETTSDWVWEVDRGGRYTYASPRVIDLLGRRPDDLIGTMPFEIMPPAEARRVAAIFQGFVRRAEPFEHIENICLHSDGSEVVMETSGVPVYGPDGELAGYRGVDRDITDRKRTEEDVAQARQNLETFFNTVDEFLFVLDDQGRIVHVNDTVLRRLGYTEEELQGQSIHAVYSADGGAEARRLVGEMLGGRSGPHPVSLTAKSGEVIEVESRVTRGTWDGRGALFGVSKDISALKRSEERLRASMRKLTLHVEQTPLGVIGWDLNFKVSEWNPAAETMFGFTQAEAIGQYASFVVPESERGHVDGVWSELLGHRGGRRSRNKNVTKDGRTILCEWYNTPLVDERDDVVGAASLVMDITERTRTEEALRAERAFTDTIIQSMPGLFYIIEEDSVRIIRRNDNWADTTGYSEAELDNLTALDFFQPGADRDLCARRMREVYDRGYSTMENRLLAKDGSLIPYYFTGHRLALGDVTYLVGVGLDMSEQEKLESQLRQAQKMEAVGQLAGGIAHDFNNILTVIQGNAELLKMDLPPRGEQMEFADEVLKGARRAADLTRQLLAFARKGRWQVVPVDMHDAIVQTVSMLTHTIDRRIEILLELQAAPHAVMGDPTQLQNALLNLGVNARDAMADGGVLTYATRNVTLAEAACDEHPYELTPGDFLEISIADTGIGMDARTQERIFEPFFTTKEVGKGTGLGLAGVYGCVKNHNGSISVASDPGQGTTFVILLPLAPAGDAAPVRPAAGAPVGGAGHVLVVDDEQSIRTFLQTSLGNLGYTVSTCPDGVAGVEHYREHHPEIDLVILDLVMPRMSGQDAFGEMKKINPNVKVLVSSGFSHSQAMRQMLDDGALALLNKPFEITELSQAVARHIRDEGSCRADSD